MLPSITLLTTHTIILNLNNFQYLVIFLQATLLKKVTGHSSFFTLIAQKLCLSSRYGLILIQTLVYLLTKAVRLTSRQIMLFGDTILKVGVQEIPDPFL